MNERGPGGQDDWPDLDVSARFDAPPLIPPGDQYTARAARAQIRPSWGGGARLHIDFELHSGDYDGKVIAFICTLPKRRARRWAEGVVPSSRFYRAWVVAAGAPPRRRDRMGLDVFKNRLFRIRVRTVTKDRAGAALPIAAQYSIVDSLLEREA